MTKNTTGIIAVVASLALVPFALIARSRAIPAPLPRIAIVQDMAKQPKFTTQTENIMFADGRSERPRIEGTLAQEDMMLHSEWSTDAVNPHVVNAAQQDITQLLKDQDQFDRVMLGQEKDAQGKPQYVSQVPAPIQVTRDFLKRGQERFNIYCSPCHGQSGYGDGMVARRVEELRITSPDAISADPNTGWAPPANLNDDERRTRNVGRLYNIITNGFNHMPRYDKQISTLDRWAIATYVKALQKSQHADVDALPNDVKQDILNQLGSPNGGAPSSQIK
jgi:mono/diheme cytochrome c family protein